MIISIKLRQALWSLCRQKPMGFLKRTMPSPTFLDATDNSHEDKAYGISLAPCLSIPTLFRLPSQTTHAVHHSLMGPPGT